MSWSPTGDRLVFEDGDDIFVIKTDGTGRRNLTSANPERDVSPAWSPDGSRILYSSRGRLYTVSPDGSNVQPAGDIAYGESHPSWSPSGERIAFAMDQTDDCFFVQGIYTSTIDLSDRQTVHGGQKCSPTLNLRPTWSPDASKILFYIGRPQENDAEVFIKNVDGSGFTQLTNTVGSNLNPSWQPRLQLRRNGKIAFTSDRDGNLEIYVMNSDGSSQVRLTNNNIVDDNPTWSPDGSKLAFVSQTANGNFAIFTMNADGTSRSVVTQLAITGYLAQWKPLSWSPDGQKLAFHDVSLPSGRYCIFVVNLDGSGRQNLTIDHSDMALTPVWSPDGTKILFSRYGTYPPFGYGGTMLHTINLDGGNLKPLVNGFADGWNEDMPDWTGVGNRIVYSVNQWDFNQALFVANPDGTGRRFLDGCGIGLCTGLDLFNPAWSPDGTQVVYSRDDAFNTFSEICVIKSDGSLITTLTSRAQGKNFSPSWQPINTSVQVSGRVTTPMGAGLRNASVTITDQLGVRRTTSTSTFGFYSFANVTAGETYTISVASRRYRFLPRTLPITEAQADIDFLGME